MNVSASFDQSLIEFIYETALDDERWDEVMERTAELYNAHFCYYARFRPAERRLLFTRQRGADADFIAQAARHIDNPWTRNGFPPTGEVIRLDDICSLQDLKRSSFYREFLGPCDSDHTMSGVVLAEKETVTTFSISRSERYGPFEDAALDSLRQLVPHLNRALQISLRLERAEEEWAALARVVDSLRAAVFLVTARGRVCYANDSAEGLARDGEVLTLARGALTPRDPHRRKELRRIIAGAVGATEGGRPSSGGCLVLEDGEGRAFDVIVSPLGRDSASGFVGSPRAIVFVGGAEGKAPSNLNLLRSLYSLTGAEARLAIALYETDGLAEAAEALGVTIATARTHLKRIFDKTGCHRQSDLIRRLLRGPLALR